MSKTGAYELPAGLLALDGPVTRPAPGTLPIRGDLAHIALANRFLVAHYVVPQVYTLGAADADLKLQPRADADTITTIRAGSAFEVLDLAGSWAWGCIGPDGPTGYVPIDQFIPSQP